MPILFWDKPAKKMSIADWKKDYGFEDGPTGGYQSNMSDADAARWKAKLTGTKLGFPQVEIRKTFGSAQMLMIVNLGEGYNYKSNVAVNPKYVGKTMKDITWAKSQKQIDEYAYPTKGINVHISLNGPAQMTFAEMQQMQQVVLEAKEFLDARETAKLL